MGKYNKKKLVAPVKENMATGARKVDSPLAGKMIEYDPHNIVAKPGAPTAFGTVVCENHLGAYWIQLDKPGAPVRLWIARSRVVGEGSRLKAEKIDWGAI